MDILIVESQAELGTLWQQHLERQGMDVARATTQKEAKAWLECLAADIIMLDLILKEGAAFAIADYANYKYPEVRIIFVTNTSFFSDGSIFAHCANARAFVLLRHRQKIWRVGLQHCATKAS